MYRADTRDWRWAAFRRSDLVWQATKMPYRTEHSYFCMSLYRHVHTPRAHNTSYKLLSYQLTDSIGFNGRYVKWNRMIYGYWMSPVGYWEGCSVSETVWDLENWPRLADHYCAISHLTRDVSLFYIFIRHYKRINVRITAAKTDTSIHANIHSGWYLTGGRGTCPPH